MPPPKARNCQDATVKICLMKGGRDENDDAEILTKKWPIEVENSGELLKPLKGTFCPTIARGQKNAQGRKAAGALGIGSIGGFIHDICNILDSLLHPLFT